MDEDTESIRQENARRSGRVNSATIEAPVYICEVCGVENCECEEDAR
jgi:hypothetical protein